MSKQSEASKYDKLDAAIIEVIGRGRRDFTGIWVGAVREECERLADESRRAHPCAPRAEPFRILDRRLQALRRGGEVQYVRGAGGGWVTAPASAARPGLGGWIKWTGGECPLDPTALVQVRLRGFSGVIGPCPVSGLGWEWHAPDHGYYGGDIVAYRVVREPLPHCQV